MSKKIKKTQILLLALVFVLFFFCPVLSGAEASVIGELEDLEDIEIKKTEKASGALGLFSRAVSENFSLLFTFGQFKKAEKRLKFSEERIRWAEILAEKSSNPKIAKRIEKIVARANKFMEKIEEKRGKILEKIGEREERLLENIAKHRLNKEKVLEKIEDRVPAERLERFQKMREAAEEQSSKFFEDILKNKKLSEELKERLKERSRELRIILKNRQRVREERR